MRERREREREGEREREREGRRGGRREEESVGGHDNKPTMSLNFCIIYNEPLSAVTATPVLL